MADSAATVYFELDAKTTKFLSELNKAASAADRFGQRTQKMAGDTATAAGKVDTSITGAMRRAAASTTQASTAMQSALGAARTSLIALVGALGVREIADYAETWVKTSKRLTAVSADSKELAANQEKLFAIAQRSGEKYQSIVNVFADLTAALRATGANTSQAATAVQALADAAEVAGQDFDVVEQALGRFAKGLTDGTADSRELRAVMLEIPSAGIAVANAMGIGVDKLKEMAKQGKLSTAEFVDALARSGPALSAQADRIANDFGELGNRINNELTRAIGQNFSGAMLGFANLATDGVIGVIRTVERLQGTFAAVGTVGVTAAAVLVNSWKAVEAGLLAIEYALVTVEAKWREWVRGETPTQNAAQRINELRDNLERLNRELAIASQGGGAVGNAPLIARLKAGIAEANAELNKLDASGKGRELVAQFYAAQKQVENLSAALTDNQARTDALRQRYEAIGRTIAGLKDAKLKVAVDTEDGRQRIASLDSQIAGLTNVQKQVRLNYEVATKGDQEAGRRIGEIEAKAASLKAQAVTVGVNIDAKGAETELGRLQARQAELAGELGKGIQWVGAEEIKARAQEIAASISNITNQATTAGTAISKITIRPVDQTAYLTGSAAGLARQKELEAQATAEQNRIVLAGEQAFSKDLIGIMTETARVRIAIAEQQARAEAALKGEDFDAEKFNAPLRMLQEQERLMGDFANKIAAKRKEAREGDFAEFGSQGIEQLRRFNDQRLNAEQAAWEASNQMRVDLNREALDLIYTDEETAGAKMLELARAKGEELARIKLEAQGVAFGEGGTPVNPEDAVRFEQERQAAVLDAQRQFQSAWSQIDAEGIAKRSIVARAAASVMGKTWAASHKATLSNMANFASSAATIGNALFGRNKKFAIATAIVDTIGMAIAAGKETPGPWPIKAAAVAAALAQGMAQVATMKSTNPDSSGGGAGIAAGGVSGGAPPNAPNLGSFQGDGQDAGTRKQVEVHFNGPMYGYDRYVQESILGAIREAVDGKDVVLFGPSSRQAALIREGG